MNAAPQTLDEVDPGSSGYEKSASPSAEGDLRRSNLRAPSMRVRFGLGSNDLQSELGQGRVIFMRFEGIRGIPTWSASIRLGRAVNDNFLRRGTGCIHGRPFVYGRRRAVPDGAATYSASREEPASSAHLDIATRARKSHISRVHGAERDENNCTRRCRAGRTARTPRFKYSTYRLVSGRRGRPRRHLQLLTRRRLRGNKRGHTWNK